MHPFSMRKRKGERDEKFLMADAYGNIATHGVGDFSGKDAMNSFFKGIRFFLKVLFFGM